MAASLVPRGEAGGGGVLVTAGPGGPSLALSHRVLQLDAAEAEPILDEREGVDEYNEMPMPV